MAASGKLDGRPGPWFDPAMLRLLAVALLVATFAAGSLRAGEWKLVWSDEFDQPGRPDPAKWGYEEGKIRNHEAQSYTRDRAENARVEDGNLVITGRRERSPGEPPADYTSASLTTEGKASWTYGRIEVRAKLPRGRGMWPAIWTLGTNIRTVDWPRCGEIDIMEFVGKEPGTIHGTLHYSQDGKHRSSQGHAPIADAGVGFHTYAVEWWPDRVDFFFDGGKYHTVPLEAGQGDAFHRPHYLILNLALGGDWGGPIDDAVLPQSFLIDYVRVYQQEGTHP